MSKEVRWQGHKSCEISPT